MRQARAQAILSPICITEYVTFGTDFNRQNLSIVFFNSWATLQANQKQLVVIMYYYLIAHHYVIAISTSDS